MAKSPSYIYEKLTWPEINRAVKEKKVPVVPIGSIEQHGLHLPLDVDCVCPRGVALHAAKLIPDKMLILPTIVHGYTGHVMDFPGTINIHWEHFIKMVLDVAKSLAYHGFKKIILLNGHGSNMPNLDLVARRADLETDAECAFCGWWNLLTVDKKFLPKWRDSYFPGGCCHAGELETSVYLYLDEDNVRKSKIRDNRITFNEEHSDFQWIDAFAAGPATVQSWTSTYTKTGGMGAADLATKEKGRVAVKEAAKQLARLVAEFSKRPRPQRIAHQTKKPSMKMPWSQQTLP